MSYRCQICEVPVGPGKKRLLHIIYREVADRILPRGVKLTHKRREIAQEIPVCQHCHQRLHDGETVAELLRDLSPRPPLPVTLARIINPRSLGVPARVIRPGDHLEKGG